MGRNRKVPINSVVRRNDGSYWTVVLYRTDVRTNRYGCIETDMIGRYPRGELRWLDSTDFQPTTRTSRKPGRIHRKNLKEGTPEERGCGCNCCVHVKGYDED